MECHKKNSACSGKMLLFTICVCYKAYMLNGKLFLDQNKVLDVIYFFQRLNSTLDNVLHILPDKIMNIETTKRPLRSTDNVHLEFLLGSVRRSPARRRSSKRNESRSTPPTPPYSLRGQEARGAKDRWKWAAREISRGYFYLRSHIEIIAGMSVES